MISETVLALKRYKFSLHSEETLKQEMAEVLARAGLSYLKEYTLDSKNRVDFFGAGTGIEVKIKGSAKSIFKQCERYCQLDEIKCLILVTCRTLGFPPDINGKPCFVVNLGTGWL